MVIENEKGDARRFLMMVLFSFCTMINACGWISFAPIGTILMTVISLNTH
jgi:hypothetical protein